MRYFIIKSISLLLFVGFTSPNLVSAQIDKDVEKTTCGGVERWSLKVLTDPAASSVNYTPVTSSIASLVTLSTPSVGFSDPRHSTLEYTTYRINCMISQKRAESDNDYHLVLSDGSHTLVGEIPDPVCSEAASSTHVSQFIACRNFIDAHIASGNVYYVSLPPVMVTGVAFVDIPHGVTGAAPNNLELHPIIDIRFVSGADAENIPAPILIVNISPNPFIDKIHVSVFSQNQPLKNCVLQLFDVFANKAAEYQLGVKSSNDIDCEVNLSNLPKGNYIYRLLNNGSLLYDGKLTGLK